MKKLISLLLLTALLLAGCGNEPAAPVETQPETTAATMTVPDFVVYDGDSNEVRLSDFFGKPIVLNFWASWCGPCKSEMPDFQKVYEELGGQVQFIMVNVGEQMSEAAAFIASTGYTFPVYYDVSNNASFTYQISSIPATFFINAKGELVTYQVGMLEESLLRTAIDMIR